MSLPVVLIHADDAIRAAVGRRCEMHPDLVVVASVRAAEAGIAALVGQPDALVLIEQQPPDGTGRVELVESLREVSAEVRVIMLVNAVEAPAAVAAMRSGVAGIIEHDHPRLADAVCLVGDGVGVFAAPVHGTLRRMLIDPPRNPLSSRERQVLSCIASGLSNAEAANKLFVSRETVKSHVAHVLRKLEVDDRLAAVDKATKIGLLA